MMSIIWNGHDVTNNGLFIQYSLLVLGVDGMLKQYRTNNTFGCNMMSLIMVCL